MKSAKLLLKICPRISEHAPQLAKSCGYLPLALRVSAGLLQSDDTQDVKRYLDRLADERSKLAALRDPDDPELDVEASLKLSYDALEPAAQEVLCQLSVLPASFVLSIAEAVVKTESGVPMEEVLGTLRRRSLLEWDAETRRYGLHDLVRAFGAARLAPRLAEQPQTTVQDTVENQAAFLATHRRRLASRLSQQAQLGAYAPPDVALDIEDALAAILDLKAALRAAGAVVADEPNDEFRTALPRTVMQSAQDRRNRDRMIQKVRYFWIRGLLEKSLPGATPIALELEQRSDVINHSWYELVQPSNTARQLSSTQIADIFDNLGGELLILGAPGAGKTTLLLELTRDLLERAQQDEHFPIPVVFNLSSWSESRRPLQDWLVDELNLRYDVPRKIGKTWVAGDLVLPLLDGLDEVASNQGGSCVDAINDFLAQHPMIPIVVCSRIADYEMLGKRLRLQGAVIIQPLTNTQVDAYLSRAGNQMSALRAALQHDSRLHDLIGSPLLLAIMALVYRSPGEIEKRGLLEANPRELFRTYIESMLMHRGRYTRYTQAQVVGWLAWLANKMLQSDQSVFYVERLQPEWLSTSLQRRCYNFGVRFLVGLLLGLPTGLTAGLSGGPTIGVVLGFMMVVVGGIGARFFGDLSHIALVEAISISPRRALVLFVVTLLVGLGGGWAAQLLGNTQLSGIIAGLLAALTAGSIGVLTVREVRQHTTPNQGIWASARNAGIAGISGGLASAMTLFLGATVTYSLTMAVLNGLVGGLFTAIVIALQAGGFIVIQHSLLRLILVVSNATPWNFISFLDDASERILLRKIGGGYIFIHRLLREYLAALEPRTHSGT